MLTIQDHGSVREIQLARPPVNALNTALVKLLTTKLREAMKDRDAVVIAGQDGLFSAGLDLVELMTLDRAEMTEFWNSFFELLETVALSTVPIAAAITGHSPAGGSIICLMCDYRVMSDGKFKIGMHATRVGLIIPFLFYDALVRLAGTRMAEHMLVAGAMVSPGKAHRIGLIDAVEPDTRSTIGHALDWCDGLLSLPAHAMHGNRAVARAHFTRAFAEHGSQDAAAFVDTWFSPESQRAMRALLAGLKMTGRSG